MDLLVAVLDRHELLGLLADASVGVHVAMHDLLSSSLVRGVGSCLLLLDQLHALIVDYVPVVLAHG